jgi:phosphoribosylaminoimidazole carboxylase
MNTKQGSKVGVLGAGQLGRMFVEAASRLNVEVHLLDVGTQAPAKQILASSRHIDGAFNNSDKIRQLASQVDILTIEIEHVNTVALQDVLDEGLVKEVHPTPSTIRLIQDKYNQKKFLVAGGVPVADFVPVGPELELGESSSARKAQEQGILDAGKLFGYPLMVKSRTQAYDGKGNYVVKEAKMAGDAVEALGNGTRGLYAERWTPFEKEVAVMVVRSSSGEVRAYPTVETYHEDSICHSVFAPLRHANSNVASRA